MGKNGIIRPTISTRDRRWRDIDPASTGSLILGHGMWSDARVFLPMIRHLRHAGPLVALDLPGHGTRAAETPARSVDDLAAAFLEAIPDDGRPAVLAGISMGAVAALHAALLAPDRIAGLVLFAASASAEPRWRRGVYRATAAVYMVAGPVAPLRWCVRRVAFGPRAGALDPACGRAVRAAAAVPRETVAASLALMADRPALEGELWRIQVPVEVIAGERDRVFPPSEAHRLAGRLSRGRLRILRGTGHAIVVEQPAAAARITDELLARVFSGGTS